MTQVQFAVESLECDLVRTDSSELIFLDDSSYEFVGGGDAVNGY